MNWRVQLQKDLKRHEGCSFTAYWDDVGKCWTIGYGHTGPEVTKGLRWTQAKVERALDKDIEEAIVTARSLFPSFDKLSKVRKTVLANMAFNLGYSRLEGFKKLRAAVAMEDWDRASLEMINSRWFSQVKGRARELVRRMADDRIPTEHLATKGDL